MYCMYWCSSMLALNLGVTIHAHVVCPSSDNTSRMSQQTPQPSRSVSSSTPASDASGLSPVRKANGATPAKTPSASRSDSGGSDSQVHARHAQLQLLVTPRAAKLM